MKDEEEVTIFLILHSLSLILPTPPTIGKLVLKFPTGIVEFLSCGAISPLRFQVHGEEADETLAAGRMSALPPCFRLGLHHVCQSLGLRLPGLWRQMAAGRSVQWPREFRLLLGRRNVFRRRNGDSGFSRPALGTRRGTGALARHDGAVTPD